MSIVMKNPVSINLSDIDTRKLMVERFSTADITKYGEQQLMPIVRHEYYMSFLTPELRERMKKQYYFQVDHTKYKMQLELHTCFNDVSRHIEKDFIVTIYELISTKSNYIAELIDDETMCKLFSYIKYKSTISLFENIMNENPFITLKTLEHIANTFSAQAA